MNLKSLSSAEKWILLGVPVLFIIGSIFHFIYEWTNNNFIIGLISPINESIFQHIKLVIIPIICWWTLYYFFKGKREGISSKKWFTGAFASLITSIISIPALYYLYTGASGKESLIIDILILFISLLFGQLLGLHFYRYSKGYDEFIILCIFIFIIVIFAIFTLYPLNIPLFIDSSIKKCNNNCPIKTLRNNLQIYNSLFI